MKKKLLIIVTGFTVTIFAIIFFALKSSPTVSAAENTSIENVSFVVYKSSDYTSTAYYNASAQLHVVIEKVNATGLNISNRKFCPILWYFRLWHLLFL